MLLIGAHRINHGTFDPQICQQIQQSSTLVVGQGTTYGAGGYAYYPNRIPGAFRRDPFVVFQALPVRAMIDMGDIYIPGGPYAGDTRFFVLRGAIGAAIQVAMLGFVNCPGFPTYPGQLYFT
jgi:hypothetical protein